MLFPLSDPRCRLLTIGTIIGGVILVLAASITITYGASTHSPWVIRMDHWALNHALAARSRPLHEVAVPPFEHTFSFPSGHTLNAVVIAGVMAYLLCQHTRSAGLRALISGCGIAYALLMGISRVFLAQPWLSDVLAGWCIGSLCLAASIVVERATAYIRQGRLHDRDSSSPPDEYSRNPVRP